MKSVNIGNKQIILCLYLPNKQKIEVRAFGQDYGDLIIYYFRIMPVPNG